MLYNDGFTGEMVVLSYQDALVQKLMVVSRGRGVQLMQSAMLDVGWWV